MTPDEQSRLSAYGGDIISQELGLIIAAAGYGAFLLASFIALQFVPAFTKKSIILVSLALIFITSAWSTLCFCGVPLTQVKFVFIQNLNEGLAVQAQVANAKTLPWSYTENWPITINLLLSDFIVCWRAWILFGGHRVWKVILVILMGANIGINVADLIWGDIHVIISAGGEFVVLDWLSTAISLSVNLVATAMIAYRAWIHYHVMAKASVAHKSRSVKLMLLLIESGAIFCALQLLVTVAEILDATLPVEQPTSKWELSFTAIESIFSATAQLYPVVVFILIHTNNSPVVETFHFTQSRLEANNSNDIPLDEISSPPDISNLVGGSLSEDRGESGAEDT